MPGPPFLSKSLESETIVEQRSTQQYGRAFSLIVFGQSLNGLDLSELRCKFSIKRSDTITPNSADIRVYNLDYNTATQIKKEFSRVVLQAGYEGNYGVIFQGNIKQVIVGRESSTDTFIDIIAGDGDRAFNYAIVNKTLSAGSKQIDQVNASIESMTDKGVTAGHLGDMSSNQLPRAKVMWGNAHNYLRNVAQTSDKSVSIQDEKVTFVSNRSYLPGEAVKITSKTGMIGTPQQTNEGINIKCLLNPNIKIGGRVYIDNASVALYKIDLTSQATAANIPPSIKDDGMYYVLVVEHQGDNRGTEWYTSLICLNISITSNPANSVSVGG